MSTIHSDVLAAWRSFRSRPVSTLGVVLTLGLGLGAAAAMFSVVDAVLLRPLPYPDEDALVLMTERHATRPQSGVSVPALREWEALAAIARLGAFDEIGGILRVGGDPLMVNGVMVSNGFFSTMGVAPALGATPGPSDPFLDPDPKLVLSDSLWRERFGARTDVIGESVAIDNRRYTITGVMPAGFEFPASARFWSTLSPDMKMLLDARSLRFLEVVARLKDGASLQQLEQQLDLWSRGVTPESVPLVTMLGHGDPKATVEWRPSAWSLRDHLVGSVRRPVLVTFAAVAVLLLVACCNVAAMLLARGETRRRPLAVQAALGASRGRLIRQLLVEGALLSLAGVLVGLVVAYATRRTIIALSLDQVPRVDSMQVDWRVFAATALLGVLTTLVCALGPALSTSRVDVGMMVGHSARTTTGRRNRLLPAIAATEVALAIVLFASAGLLIHSYVKLLAVDVGVDARGVSVARVTVPLGRPWNDEPRRRAFHEDVLSQVNNSGEVTAAGWIARLPLEPVRGGVDVRAADADPKSTVLSVLQQASEGYFEAVGATRVDGRDFSAADRADQPPVAIVNDVLGRHLFPSTSAVGRRLTFMFMRGPIEAEVVGVVKAVRYDGLAGELRPEVYLPFRQTIPLPMSLVVRTSHGGMMPAGALRNAVAMAGAGPTLDSVSALDDRLDAQFARPRFFLALFGTFAIFAVVLAMLGLYGTLAFWTAQHRRELGVRLALGATREHVAALVLRRGLFAVIPGLAVGLLVVLASGRFLQSLLFDVQPADPRTLLIAATGLLIAAVLACLLPSRRAARVDPIEVLRAE